MVYEHYKVRNSFYEITGKSGYKDVAYISLHYDSKPFPKEIVEKYPFRIVNNKNKKS